MKTTLLTLFLALFFVTTHVTAQDCKPQKRDATVEQIQGVYVFVESRPSTEYSFLGTVKAGTGFGKAMWGPAEFEEKKLKLVKLIKKQYPDADGVILRFVSGGKDAADAIKFKADN